MKRTALSWAWGWSGYNRWHRERLAFTKSVYTLIYWQNDLLLYMIHTDNLKGFRSHSTTFRSYLDENMRMSEYLHTVYYSSHMIFNSVILYLLYPQPNLYVNNLHKARHNQGIII